LRDEAKAGSIVLGFVRPPSVREASCEPNEANLEAREVPDLLEVFYGRASDQAMSQGYRPVVKAEHIAEYLMCSSVKGGPGRGAEQSIGRCE